ncbi:MAG TPA: carbohydrate binding domain-containing protein [Thermodesulfobacteriota bacterium]|nr:carbohydrate binding domain-containing protein [Thermodesulfobacteriota bacterium]
MNRSYYGLRILLIVLTLFFIEETVRLGLSSILADREELSSLEEGLALDPSDAELNYRLARLNYLFTSEDGNRIRALYVRSLELSPLFSSSWLGLTEVFAENGEKQRALITLKRAVELSPFYISRLWEASILALRLGFQPMAIESLRTVAKADPARRERVFDVCWELINDPDLILKAIVTDDSLPSYLRYLISRGRLKETFPVWDRMKKIGMVSKEIASYYMDFLIARDESSMALSIWTDMFGRGKDNSLVWNGGFESDPMGTFDWKIKDVDGVKVTFDSGQRFEGNYSLKLRFDGEHNVDFYHISQIVPVEPDTDYILTSYVATMKITTKNGIGWEVFCYPRINMTKSTDPVVETTGWRRVELSFHTPSDCRAVVIRLRRYKSNRIDKYISGTAWVDDVKLFKVGLKADAQGGEKGI